MNLDILKNQPISDMWRYGGRQKFEFGMPKRGLNKRNQEVSYTETGLIVSCHWSIAKNGVVIVSHRNFRSDGRDDYGAYSFYKKIKLFDMMVSDVILSGSGDLSILMTGGYSIDITPCLEDRIELDFRDQYFSENGFLDDEQWRFISSSRRKQLVYTHSGFEKLPITEFTSLVAVSMMKRKPVF